MIVLMGTPAYAFRVAASRICYSSKGEVFGEEDSMHYTSIVFESGSE